MANLMQLINKSKTIEEKAKALTADLISQFKHGKIKTQQEMLYKSYIALKNFYNSIGKPTMQKRYAKGAPSSIDYNNTMKEIYNDLHVISTESDNLASVLQEAYNTVEIDRQQLDNKVNLIQKKLEKVQFKLANAALKNVFMDSFVNMNYIDKESCTLKPVYINTNYGYISLASTETNVVNSEATVTMTDDSNGFPGNTHQINVIDNEPKFIGEEGIHMNLADILDNNSDTWFEYEVYKIDDTLLIETLGLGYDYEEGRKWIMEENKLRLGILISFSKPQLINTLSMAPFIPPDKDAVPSIIRSIIVSDGKGRTQNLINGIDSFDKDKIYSFPKQYCKTALIVLEQELSYSTTIGHIYFKELSNQNIDYFKLNEMKFNQRTIGPKPRIENLKITYDDNEQRYIQPIFKYGETIDNEATIKNNLFKIPETDSDVKGYIEALTANRYHLGIRDITLSNFSYESESEYISKNFESQEPINAVSLEVDDFVPTEFESILDLDGHTIDWIQYFFSVDDGTTWHPIIPKGEFKHTGYGEYLINASVPSELRRSDVGYIEVSEEVYSVKVKILMQRPTELTDSDYYSPIVYEYKLELN